MRTQAVCIVLAIILSCCFAAAQMEGGPSCQGRLVPHSSDLDLKSLPRTSLPSSTVGFFREALLKSAHPMRKTTPSQAQPAVIDTAIVRGNHLLFGWWWSSDTTRHIYSFNGAASRTSDLTQKLLGNDWVDSLRETDTYDANNNMLSQLKQFWSDGQWVDTLRTTYSCDDQGRTLSQLDETWSEGQWKNDFRYTFTYDPNGLSISTVAEDSQNGQWRIFLRATITFADNAHQRPISIVTDWLVGGLWMKDRTTYTYDANGSLISFLAENWSIDQWVNETRDTFTNDAQGNVLTDTYDYWSNDQWVSSTRHTYTYDGMGDRLSDVQANYSNGQWADTLQSTYTYDGQGHELSELDEYRDGSWWSRGRYEYSYNSTGKLISFRHYAWAGNDVWLPAGVSTSIYLTDDAGNYYYYDDWYSVDLSYRTITGVPSEGGKVPSSYVLSQNYPNPFNPTTTITYELPQPSEVRLSVYDLVGREVSVLVNERQIAGIHEIKFDATGLSSGAYFYRLQAGDVVQTRKLLLLR